MGEQIEKLNIQKISDNEFEITRTIVEKVSGEDLIKIYDSIKSGIDAAQVQLDDIPKQVSERISVLEKEKSILSARILPFEEYAKPLIDEKERHEREQNLQEKYIN